jgi:hypothetical protein
MGAVVHLLKGGDATLARAVIDQHVRAGDHVTVVVLPGGAAADLPAAVDLRRVDGDLSYSELLDLIFSADRVVAW